MRKTKAKRSAVPKTEKLDLPESVDRILRDHASRIHEACAILQLSSDLITSTGGPMDMNEGANVMSAIDGALRILKPIPSTLGCRVTMQQTIEEQEASHG